jgi:hypothetical protein
VFKITQQWFAICFCFVAQLTLGAELPAGPQRVESGGLKSAPFTYSNTVYRQDLDTTSWTDLTEVILSVSGSGHPVFIGIVPVAQSAKDQSLDPYSVVLASQTSVGKGSFTSARLRIIVVRDSEQITMSFDTLGFIPTGSPLYEMATEIPYGLTTVDLPGAGEHKYQVKVKASGPIEIKGARLIAYEL